jgi:hypothetical protein
MQTEKRTNDPERSGIVVPLTRHRGFHRILLSASQLMPTQLAAGWANRINARYVPNVIPYRYHHI